MEAITVQPSAVVGDLTTNMASDNENEASSDSIVVGVRLRPFVAYEKGQKQCLTIRGNVVSVVADVVGGDKAKDFKFDQAMDSTDPSHPAFAGQAKCYDLMARSMVGHVFSGYSTCLFCYGQTGTGKTTTIMGASDPPSEQGLLLRLLSEVFIETDRLKKEGSVIHIKVQMLEVYNEKLRDLLTPKGAEAKQPDVHVHPKLGVYLKGVTEEAVESCDRCIRLIDYGNTMKTIAATAMNARSSRGHTIFKLIMEKTGGTNNMATTSEVFFVDLAGRENEKTTKAAGDRLMELSFINRSLMFLSHCISSLGDPGAQKRKTMIARKSMAPEGMGRKSMAPGAEPAHFDGRKSMAPGKPNLDMGKFRNSKLTLLLSNALNGNSKTSMIGTLSPAVANFEESISTLNFANTVKNIKVDAKPASAVDKESLVISLQDELKQLREQLAAAQEKIELGSMVDEATQEDVRIRSNTLTEKIEATQSLSVKFSKRWEDDQQESDKAMAQREKVMDKIGAGRWTIRGTHLCTDPVRLQEIECPLPYLANHNHDPHLSGRIMLHPGEVGKEYIVGYGEECDFLVPHGLGMASQTCLLRRDFGRLFLKTIHRRSSADGHDYIPGPNGRAEVNGVKVRGKDWVELHHQDCVVLGRSLMFYAFTKPDGGVAALPPNKQQQPGEKEGSESSETLLNNILGPARSGDVEQLHLARKYYAQLQNQNLDAEGATSLHSFLLQACRAMKMVEEANEITADVKPTSNIQFELVAMAPMLSFGFGSSSFPEFCVRLVRKLPESRAARRVSLEVVRRKSTFANSEMLKKFTNDGLSQSVEAENARVEVVHTWHFPKFAHRLQLMQDVHEAWTQDSENFTLDTYNDPWSEYGLGEIAQLQQEHKEEISCTHDELQKLRDECIGRDSHVVHTLLTHTRTQSQPETGPQASPRAGPEAKTVVATADLLNLRESHRQLEFANRALRADLAKAQADAKAALARLGTTNGSGKEEPFGGGDSPGRQRDRTPKARGADDRASSSSQARGCLELSKANLALVEDLFRLSLALLRAGTATMQAQAAEPGGGPPSSARAEQGRLAEAASDLVALLTNNGLGGMPEAATPVAPWAYRRDAGNPMEAVAAPAGAPVTYWQPVAAPSVPPMISGGNSAYAQYLSMVEEVGYVPGLLSSSSAATVEAQGVRRGPARTPAPMSPRPTHPDAQGAVFMTSGPSTTPVPANATFWQQPMRTQMCTTPGRMRPMVAGPWLAGSN